MGRWNSDLLRNIVVIYHTLPLCNVVYRINSVYSFSLNVIIQLCCTLHHIDFSKSLFLTRYFQIKSESFLEDLNNVLNSGDVPNIYQPDELDKIYQGTRGLVQEMGLAATKSNLFAVYTRQVRTNLHTVISMRWASGDWDSRATGDDVWLDFQSHRGNIPSEVAPVSRPGELLYDRLVQRVAGLRFAGNCFMEEGTLVLSECPIVDVF